ncbi:MULTISPECIES: hypothetical protein [unclassified Streptomyces]|uniref:hypothetical protein n=1 Tax=unclassified Streptomyces TaxID=2593676 RepID=UPI0001C1944B|nr:MULTISPECIES: hypothetical protein [unclassified Streptomyces]MYR68332.1 hypothetical protein [Streptomyces sp. SID4939]MYS02669.1 hypothetical protein [Streptomyces sp. SID4940]MYT66687.1 hypothetical protein [Streptomyces sp. SID8357]MYT83608.1 hypothetical protein [Streptomyces sp. SID8360]MYW35661.1 hypothetical protein [Streptomyces sp. SID1]MYX71720.1 hypothetical protein [Streptomyces sp. SID3915]
MTATTGAPSPVPFLLTPQQGEAARRLLSYVTSLPLRAADAQLLAVVVAIRAAQKGVGNLTGQDLRSLRLADAEGAVAAVTALGWQVRGDLIGGNPDIPVGIAVPGLADGPDRLLPFGKVKRSRVSGWTSRTLNAKPVKKTPPAMRLAALYLAAHAKPDLPGALPADMPEHCRAVLPDLLAKGFLKELDGTTYLLADAVRHLSGMRPPPAPAVRAREEDVAEPLSWDAWKAQASVALRRHVEAVENCPRCSLSPGRVSEAFMRKPVPAQLDDKVLAAYAAWRHSHPQPGPRAAQFAAEFRAAHGHGPSVKQLCQGLADRKQSRRLRIYIVRQLIAEGWLTNTEPVPWTLRPGKAAQPGAPVSSVSTRARTS